MPGSFNHHFLITKKGEGERRRHHFSCSVFAEDTLQVGAAGNSDTCGQSTDELSSGVTPTLQPRAVSAVQPWGHRAVGWDCSLCSRPAQHQKQLTGNKSLSDPASPQGPTIPAKPAPTTLAPLGMPCRGTKTLPRMRPCPQGHMAHQCCPGSAAQSLTPDCPRPGKKNKG